MPTIRVLVKHFAWTVILLSNFHLSPVRAADQAQWQGTWTATVGSSARPFAGTWNAVPGEGPHTVTGSWSLRDHSGAEVATGTWAAAKQGKVWKGTWQARRPSGQVYDGTWMAQLGVAATSHLPDLFEAAIAEAVSGSWRMGNYAGAWAIRASAQK